MSLNSTERFNTSKELKENLKMSHLAIEDVAAALNTSVSKINQMADCKNHPNTACF